MKNPKIMNKFRRLLLMLVALVGVGSLSAQQNLWQTKGVTSPELLDDNSVVSPNSLVWNGA